MPARTPRDETLIEVDLLEVLAFKGFVCPEGVEIEVVLENWVIEPERELTTKIIDGLLGEGAPLQHPNGDEERICVTSRGAVDEYVREAEKDLL